jgi:hypothetical protein
MICNRDDSRSRGQRLEIFVCAGESEAASGHGAIGQDNSLRLFKLVSPRAKTMTTIITIGESPQGSEVTMIMIGESEIVTARLPYGRRRACGLRAC